MEEEFPSATRGSFAPAQTGLTPAALQALLAQVAAQPGGSAHAAPGFLPTSAAMNPVNLFSQLLANPGQLAQLSALNTANAAHAAPGHAQYLQQHQLHSQSVPMPASQQQQQGAASNNYASRHQQAEARRRSRINERLDALRRIVPHSERANTAIFLEEVVHYVQRLQRQVAALEAAAGRQPSVAALDPPISFYGGSIGGGSGGGGAPVTDGDGGVTGNGVSGSMQARLGFSRLHSALPSSSEELAMAAQLGRPSGPAAAALLAGTADSQPPGAAAAAAASAAASRQVRLGLALLLEQQAQHAQAQQHAQQDAQHVHAQQSAQLTHQLLGTAPPGGADQAPASEAACQPAVPAAAPDQANVSSDSKRRRLMDRATVSE